MPVYVHKCENGHQFDVINKVADYNNPSVCECGAASKRIMVPTMISPDMQPWDRYISPASGKPITSYKERQEDMKRTGCVDYDPGMRKVNDNQRKSEDTALEKKLDDTVEKTISEMPAEKLQKLENELSSGADISYTRV